MTDKQFFWKTVIYSLSLLALIAILIGVIDPFVHYHSPYFGLAVTETEERGQQIGVAKNCDYDTAIIGTSMSENFVASWFNDGICGNKTVKLCMQGAHFDDLSRLLDVVLSKDTTKNVYISLDNYILLHNPAEYPTTIPEYLENDKFSDDAYYLLNKSVALVYLPEFIINNFTEDFSSDSAYCWAKNYTFDKYVARATYSPYRIMQQQEEESIYTYYATTYQFLDSVTPYIESRPDVNFVFFVPPYSILYWDDSVLRGRLAAEISAMAEAYGPLLWKDNVRIFYFQDNWDIITDLDNYKDYSHYSQDINRYMYECMRDGKNEFTKEGYYDRLLEFQDKAASYDYESAFH